MSGGQTAAQKRAAYRAEHREEIAAYQATYYAAHREERTAYLAAYSASGQFRDRRYKLLPGEWDAMFAAQGNSCAVCCTTEPGGKHNQWHTDHDHDTGKVRGILCIHCNWGIGHFRDDPGLLMAAAEYLAAATP